jgi:Ca2+-binding EF-hand superfamily protein
MVETSNDQKVYIEDYDPVEDKIFVEKVVTPFMTDIYNDFKMRGGSKSTGISRSQFLDYSNLSEVIAMRIFSIFDADGDDVLNEDEFIQNIIAIFVAPLEAKLTFCFRIFDIEAEGKLT